jgi:hypothetical protein
MVKSAWMPEVSRSKAEALAALDDEYRRTLLAVKDYSDEDFEIPRAEGGMSPKDAFAHMAWWNWEAPSGLERIRRDEIPFWAHLEELDELNAGTLAEHKDWPLHKVMDDFVRSHDALVAALETVTEEEFGRKSTHKYRDGTLDGMMWFAFIYIEHYEEHRSLLVADR